MPLLLSDERAEAERRGQRGQTPGITRADVASTILVIALYLAVAVAMTWHAWSTGVASHMQAGADQFTTLWFLRWLPFAVGHAHNPLYTNYANYPFGVNLLNNTAVPLLGLAAAPVTLLWGPVATFNTLSTVALGGSATAGYFFTRRWTEWRPAAFVAGLLYGFSPYEIAESNGGHLNLTFVILPPIILLAVHEVIMGRTNSHRRWGIVLGALVTAQFFVSSEILVSTLVVGACCVVAAAIIGHRSVRSRLGGALEGGGWAVGVAAVLLAYPVWFALRGPAHIKGPIQLVPEAYRADLLGPLVPDLYTWLAPSGLVRVADGFANSTSENGSYLGITLLVTLAVGTVVLWRRSPVVRVAAIGGAAAFVLSLGGGLVVHRPPAAVPTGAPLPERLFTKLPLLANTIPVRYSLYVTLFAGLVLAIVLDRLHAAARARAGPPSRRRGWSTPGRAWAAPAVLALFCLVPLVPNGPISGVTGVPTPSYFTSSSLAEQPAGQVTVLYPYPSLDTPEGQLWQAMADLHFRSPGGYFLVPDGPGQRIGFSAAVGYGADTLTARVFVALYAGHPPAQTAALRAAVLAQWGSWRVSSLVAELRPQPYPAPALGFITWLVGKPPTRVEDVEVWDHFPA
jgi:hypothetical protein